MQSSTWKRLISLRWKSCVLIGSCWRQTFCWVLQAQKYLSALSLRWVSHIKLALKLIYSHFLTALGPAHTAPSVCSRLSRWKSIKMFGGGHVRGEQWRTVRPGAWPAHIRLHTSSILSETWAWWTSGIRTHSLSFQQLWPLTCPWCDLQLHHHLLISGITCVTLDSTQSQDVDLQQYSPCTVIWVDPSLSRSHIHHSYLLLVAPKWSRGLKQVQDQCSNFLLATLMAYKKFVRYWTERETRFKIKGASQILFYFLGFNFCVKQDPIFCKYESYGFWFSKQTNRLRLWGTLTSEGERLLEKKREEKKEEEKKKQSERSVRGEALTGLSPSDTRCDWISMKWNTWENDTEWNEAKTPPPRPPPPCTPTLLLP